MDTKDERPEGPQISIPAEDYSLQSDVPRDKYDIYLSSGIEQADPLNNVRNIFAESNVEDRERFETVKEFLHFTHCASRQRT